MVFALSRLSCCDIRGFRNPQYRPQYRHRIKRPLTTSPNSIYFLVNTVVLWGAKILIVASAKKTASVCRLLSAATWVYNSEPSGLQLGFINNMSWIVARTEPKRERVAVNFIERQGRQCYLPLCRDSQTSIISPLFPSYLFVFNLDGAWHWLQRTFGISCLIMRSGMPDLMHDNILESLRNTERHGLIPVSRFNEGDKVDLVQCAFSGWTGIFKGMNAKDRCTVLLEMLGQSVPVTIDLDNLKVAA